MAVRGTESEGERGRDIEIETDVVKIVLVFLLFRGEERDEV